MGCCKCNLYTYTNVAGVFGIILSVYTIAWTTFITYEKLSGGSNVTKIDVTESPNVTESLEVTESTFFTEASNVTNSINVTEPSKIQKIIKKFDNDNTTTAYILFITVLITTFLHILWLISSFILIRANSKKYRTILCLWIVIALLILIMDVASTSYFTYDLLKDGLPDFKGKTACEVWVKIQYPIIFGKAGIFLVASIIFIIVVALRRRSIDTFKKSCDFWGTSYSLEQLTRCCTYEEPSVINPAVTLQNYNKSICENLPNSNDGYYKRAENIYVDTNGMNLSKIKTTN
ncbi:uncharacterized protein [Centruroides vittatus]|uniref:uncharacterized protein n=1 Tax=Centruroides vittatus TaxID=120091 RepID=UPI00350EF9C2